MRNTEDSESDCCGRDVLRDLLVVDERLHSRLSAAAENPAAMSASASPGAKYAGVSHVVYAWQLHVVLTTSLRWLVIGGICTVTFGTSVRERAEYFSTSVLTCALSTSPTIARLALLGVVLRRTPSRRRASPPGCGVRSDHVRVSTDGPSEQVLYTASSTTPYGSFSTL
jgi:hypothetical protein